MEDNNIYVAPDDIRGKTGEIKFMQDFLRNKEGLRNVSESGLPFVTISRESASGGHLLSHVLMSDFLKQTDPGGLFRDWHIFDRELCEIIAQDAEIQKSVEQLLHHKYHSEFKDFVNSLFTGDSDKYTLHRTTSRITHMLAALGKVIIVSGTACCITRDLKAGIHVRLVAPEAKRVAWMMKRFNMHKDEAQKAVTSQDTAQKNLTHEIFNKKVDDPILYDTVWNTSRVEMHEISRAIIDMIRDRARKPSRQSLEPEI
jgi:cytidylate kinase